MLSPPLALLALGLAADVATTPAPTSPTAEIITVVCSGVVGILVAVTGLVQVRRRRAAAEAAPAQLVDAEDRPSRLRERLTALEVRAGRLESDVEDLRAVQQLHRAVDVATETDASSRRRRQEKR